MNTSVHTSVVVALHSTARRVRRGLLLSFALATPALAQVPLNPSTPAPADTTHKYENPTGVSASVPRTPFFKQKLVKALLVPTALIGYGAYTFNGGGFYTNQDARRDIHRLFPASQTRVADILIFVPYLELGAVALAGVQSRNDRLNLLLVIAKSEAIMLSSTFIVKALSHEERPDGSDNLSFPSGHTAQAFLAASIVHTEFRDKSQWYGIGAYAVATSVGVLRMVVDISIGRATWWPARASASYRLTWPISPTVTAGAASPSGAMWVSCPPFAVVPLACA